VIVLDASVLIAYLNRRDAHHASAKERLRALVVEPFAASAVTLGEVLVLPTRSGRLPAARAALEALQVLELPVHPDSGERLAVLRAETQLKLPDCCVLLAAEDEGARVLTFDDRLARAAERRGLAAALDG
jgi:predicted nucleic acid-binding protein